MKTKLVHCSYHKCLTVYFSNVLSKLYNNYLVLGPGYRHFNSQLDTFYAESHNFKIASINNHSLDFEKLGDAFRITRFIRDPRDLVVSGYFYHRRGAEAWCNTINPKDEDWKIVNGVAPIMEKGSSFTSYLRGLSEEDGLIAEIDFRINHFESMKNWPISDPRIKVFRYEDVLGNEADVFRGIFSHYGVSSVERWIGTVLADRFSANKQTGSEGHIRNPKSGQWKDVFTPKVRIYFEQRYGDILELFNYE